MTSNRQMIEDALFMIAYVGIGAAMVVLTATLWAHSALGVEMGPLHTGAMAVNALGWMVLPFATTIYSRLTGNRFSWRATDVADIA